MNQQEISYNTVICRYNEIALKGKNRWKFEQFLIGRISKLLANSNLMASKIRGRILIHHQDYSPFSTDNLALVKKSLGYVFGLDSYSFAIRTESKIDSILAITFPAVKCLINELQKNKTTITFRVRVKRTDKTSFESKKSLENELASAVIQQHPFLKVNLTNADISLFSEIHKEHTFIYFSIEPGQKGLPSGSNPPVLALLSGGFDSPVASYMMMRRGVYVDFLSFHSAPFTPPETTDKIKRIAKELNKFQGKRQLFLCNFLEVQKEICTKVYETFRTIHYRRIMFKLAQRIALENGNKALVTGESVGQVASQTIVNLSNIESAIEMLVLRPLVAMDKHDTMEIARKIGTHNISAEQVPDSCTVFSPSNPSTSASRGMILAGESKMNIQELVDLAYANTVLIDTETGKETPLSEVFKTQ
ncbi:MAG TPA: tRNA 4-thiouridine(8) synthase ThiI [Lentisphaeria bacterium]|nr:MAG: tRNA 4-thiouridine(8) synthase ThiI [Lentisphaerae bacterium GWF2_38_69]HBM16027.1 tRNA 4-thiouridine(8) synthase ThiI [Lentisphaeria bacterium]